jgi:hypothetical protein
MSDADSDRKAFEWWEQEYYERLGAPYRSGENIVARNVWQAALAT